ncbi:MAG: phage tail protein, partial [Christensenellales bacterium]
ASISEFINGIDWVKLAGDLSRGIWSVVTSVFNLLLGFIKELDWKKLGNDAWNAVVTFITEYDFESLWKLAFETFGAALGGVLNLAVGLVEGIWNTLVEAWNASEGYFAPFIEEAGGNVSLGLLNGIISGLGDIAKWVYETIVSPFMTALLESFGVEWTTVEEWFVQAWNDVSGWAIQAWEDIKEVWNTVATWFDENVIQPLVDFFTPIVTWFENDIIKPLKEKWDGLVKSFRELVGVIKEKVIDPIVRFYENVLYPKIKVVLEWLGNLFSTVWNAIKTVILTVVGAIWAGLQVAWGWIKAGFETAFNTIKTIFMTVYNVIASIAGMVIGVFDGIIQFVTGIFTGDWDKAWEGIKTIFTSIWEGIRDTIKGVINGIIGFINGMIQGIVSGINAVIGVLNKLNIHIPDWVPLFGNKSIGFNIAPISAPQIPLLATGAVIPANAPFLAVLGDQKHGRNIEAPESMLRDLIREELSKHNGGQQEITVKFAGTMGALVRAMQPYLESEQVRRGQSFAKAVRVS